MCTLTVLDGYSEDARQRSMCLHWYVIIMIIIDWMPCTLHCSDSQPPLLLLIRIIMTRAYSIGG